jgi:hypothetical protein
MRGDFLGLSNMELNSVGDSDRQTDILQEMIEVAFFLLIWGSKYFLGREKYVQNFHQNLNR